MRLPRHTYRLVVGGCGPLADDWSVPSYKTHSPPRQYISYSESCSISVWRTYLCSFSISLIDGKIDLACHPSVTHSHYVILGEELRTFNPIPHTSAAVRTYVVVRVVSPHVSCHPNLSMLSINSSPYKGNQCSNSTSTLRSCSDPLIPIPRFLRYGGNILNWNWRSGLLLSFEFLINLFKMLANKSPFHMWFFLAQHWAGV